MNILSKNTPDTLTMAEETPNNTPEPKQKAKELKLSPSLAKKNINFFTTMETTSKNSKSSNLPLLIILLLVVVNIIAIGSVWGLKAHKENQITQAKAFLTQSDVLATLAMDEALNIAMEVAQMDVNVSNNFQAYLEKLDGFRSEIYQIVTQAKPSTVTIVGFAFSNDAVSINCTTPKNIPPADYAKALEETDIFAKVSYLGFTTEATEAQEQIVFPIVCLLKEGAFDEATTE